MNKTLIWLAAAALTLTLVSSSEAQNAKERTGKVVRIKGDARYSTGNKVWQPLKVGTILKSGNVVQTAPNSFADIVVNEEATAPAVAIKPMSAPKAGAPAAGSGGGAAAIPTPDQDVIRILDDSYLIFDSLTAVATGADTVTETMLDLKKGSIFGSVKKQAAASRFEIKIPNGVAGIRGTIFMVSAAGNVSCLTGSVIAAFTDASGNVATQVVGGGQQFNTSTGQGGTLAAPAMSSLSGMASEAEQIAEQSQDKGRGKGRGNDPQPDRGNDIISRSQP